MRPNAACLIAAACLAVSAAVGAAPRPANLVIIMADDLGYGDVGYQGGSVPTPHIDSIARGGIILTDGYVTCPVCAPSRAGLLTGQYQQRFGFWDNIGPYRVSEDTVPGIPADLPILSERLKPLGYITGLFGKTHDGDAEELMAFNRWDEFYGFNNGASNYLGDMNRSHNPIFHNRTIVSSPYTERGIQHRDVCVNGAIIRDEEHHLTDRLGEMAAAFIEDNRGRPFLCYVPFNAIHGPFQAPKTLIDRYAHIEDPKRRRVAAMLHAMDRNVGRILEALAGHDLMSHTLIIFLSDNGGHEASPNTPLRGRKGTFWEGGLRVPFCMRWDGVIAPGQVYGAPVTSLDILPTAVAAAGAEPAGDWRLDGVDLLPYVTDQAMGRPHETLYWAWGPRKAIRHEDMKALSNDNGRTWSLFDLADDIAESRDLADARPAELRDLVARHASWAGQLIPPQWGWNKALGYRDPGFGQPRPYHRRNRDREPPAEGAAKETGGTDERPNIVLVMADDMGYECLSCNGALDYNTPRLDALASRGIRFRHCYSLPICTPSRVKLMTGRYSFRNYERFGLLPTTEITFAKVLGDVGYRTAMVGKWQLGGDWRTPTQFGFDEYCLQNGISPGERYDRHTRGPSRYWGYPAITANGELYESPHTYGPDMLNAYAVDFIRRQGDQPFFLYYPMLLTHSPFEPSPDTPGDNDKDGRTSEVRYFKDMVEYTDHLVGNIVDALEETGHRENTLIMFTGDNGTTYPVRVTASCEDTRRMVATEGRVGRLVEAGTASPRATGKRKGYIEGPVTRTTYGDVPGGKDLMTRAGTHVPLVVDWPRYADAYARHGNTADDLIDFSDFFVTLADLAGADLPRDRTIDGVSFADRLRVTGQSPREYIFCHYWGFGRRAEEARDAVHDGRWKLYNDGRFHDTANDRNEATAIDPDQAAAPARQARRRLERAYLALRGIPIPVEPAPCSALQHAGRTLEQQLERGRENARRQGRPFDPAQTTRWFHAKDLNSDGLLDAGEIKSKVRPDWNRTRP